MTMKISSLFKKKKDSVQVLQIHKMYVYFLYTSGETEIIEIKRFSNLSENKSQFYYYERPGDDWGKGICIPREKVDCFEIAPCIKADWEK